MAIKSMALWLWHRLTYAKSLLSSLLPLFLEIDANQFVQSQNRPKPGGLKERVTLLRHVSPHDTSWSGNWMKLNTSNIIITIHKPIRHQSQQSWLIVIDHTSWWVERMPQLSGQVTSSSSFVGPILPDGSVLSLVRSVAKWLITASMK